MEIRPVQQADAEEWLRMRLALYDETAPEKEASEIAHFLADPPRPLMPTLHAVFVYPRVDGGLCGMVEVSIRPYADGCDTNNVGYLEAWYVDPDMRHQGIGRGLVQAAEDWARDQGCHEIASDTDLENVISQAAHQQLGFAAVGRIVQFCKQL